MDTSAIPITELVPHGPRMTVIDKLQSYEAQRSVAIADVRADSVFLDGNGVPAWAGIEYMAQAVAAHAGAEARLRGARPAVGFLVGTRAYRSDVAEFPLGSRLTITVQPLWAEGSLSAFDCSIGLGDGDARPVATAVINAYVPSADELARLQVERPRS
jgi:predicted hotdog family 3-hydroxylacyl-ACP dehydratase